MAVEEWQKAPSTMAAEAIATLQAVLAGEIPPAAMAGAIIIAAHQVPELVEAGVFQAAEFDDAAMEAMAAIVDIAADWDDEHESLVAFVATLDEEDFVSINRAARPWAQAVLIQMAV